MYFLSLGRLLITIAFVFEGVSSVVLKNITVPPIVLIESNNDMQTVVLDCELQLNDKNSFIVIKWFKDNQAVYQWIRGQKPTVFPHFKGKVDEGSDKQNKEYKSLILTDPDIHTAGIYKCMALTDTENESLEKKLQVIDIANHSLRFFHQKNSNETRLVCEVDNVFPSPEIHFTKNNDFNLPVQSLKINKDENGLFNATAIAIADDFDGNIYEYKCTVTFLELSFNLSKTISSGNLRITVSTSLILIVMFSFLL